MMTSKYTQLSRSLCGRGIALLTVTCLATTPLMAQKATGGGDAPELTAAALKAIDKGLKFLLTTQKKDGSWDLDGGMQVHYGLAGARPELLSYTVNIPKAGNYEFTAHVCTVTMERKFLLRGNRRTLVDVDIPYTKADWMDTKPVELELKEGRYPARKKQKTMLGKIQYKWLCDGLKNSKSRYKVLVSGTQFGRAKSDGWAGNYYLGERAKLFSFIFENNISGVIGISGDVHRSDIYKLPMGKDRHFYDFTSGSLSRTHRTPPNPLPQAMIHSYGKTGDNNMYGEIEFRPASDKNAAVIFRSLSAENGLVYEHKLTPDDLALEE